MFLFWLFLGMNTESVSASRLSREPGRVSDKTFALILDAAMSCYEKLGAINTKVADILQASGVGRTTFYRYFKNREQVLAQAIIRDLENLMLQIQPVLAREEQVEGKLIEGMMFCLREFGRSPALRLLAVQNASDLIGDIGLNDKDLNYFGAEFCKPVFDQAVEENLIRDGVNLEAFVEWVTRILISLQITPTQFQKDNIKMRLYLKTFLLPGLIKTD